MNDSQLKRFFNEVYHDPNMYEEYLHKEAFINHDIYLKWIQQIRTQNKKFAHNLYVHPNDVIVESAMNENLTVSEYLFHNKAIVLEKNFEKPALKNVVPGNENFYYVCNGFYSDTLDNIYRVLNKGRFTVGICCEKKTELYKEIVNYYTKLKTFLLRNGGYQTSSLEINNGGNDRIYFLNYDSRKGKNKGCHHL